MQSGNSFKSIQPGYFYTLACMKQFFFKSTVLSLIVGLLGTILYLTVFKAYYLSVLPLVLVFFYLITNLVHGYLLKISAKSGSGFTSKYMAISFLKMFFYLAAAIVFVILNRDQAKPFIVNFLLLYIVYTVFEVNEFLKVVKQVD